METILKYYLDYVDHLIKIGDVKPEEMEKFCEWLFSGQERNRFVRESMISIPKYLELTLEKAEEDIEEGERHARGHTKRLSELGYKMEELKDLFTNAFLINSSLSKIEGNVSVQDEVSTVEISRCTNPEIPYRLSLSKEPCGTDEKIEGLPNENSEMKDISLSYLKLTETSKLEFLVNIFRGIFTGTKKKQGTQEVSWVEKVILQRLEKILAGIEEGQGTGGKNRWENTSSYPQPYIY